MSRFALASDARPPLWQAALSDYAFAADITGSQAVSPAQRNGVAVGKPTGGVDCPGSNGETKAGRDCFSGLGLVTDRWGNQIWITREGNPRWELMEYYKLWGRGGQTYTIPLPRFFGSSESGENALLLMEKRRNNPDGRHFNALARYAAEGISANGGETTYHGFWYRYQYRFEYDSAPGILRNIDLLCQKIGGKVDGPIVILLVGEPVTIGDIAANFQRAAAIICSTLAPFVGSLNIPELSVLNSPRFRDVVGVISNTYEYFARGGTLDVSNIGQLVGNIAGLVTPAEYRPQLTDAIGAYQYYLRGDYGGVARSLGVATSLIQGLGGDIFTTLAQAEAIARSSKGDAAQVVQNLANMKMIDSVATWAQHPSAMIDAIINQESGLSYISAVPRLRDWLLASAGGMAGQVIPNAPSIVSAALTTARDPVLGDGIEVASQLALSALGYVAADGTFDELAYNSLRSQVQSAKQQAAQLSASLTGYMLPAAVPQNKRALWAQYLREDEGIAVGSTLPVGHVHYREWY